MARVWAVMHKEFIHILRDRRTLSLIIFMPILMLLLLGYAVSKDIDHIPLAVADQSNTDASRAFTDKYWLSTIFDEKFTVSNQQELIDLIDQGKALAGLFIPPEFGGDLSTGSATDVVIFIDASDPTVGSVMQLAAETIGQESSAQIQIQQIKHSLGNQLNLTSPITTHMEFLYNPEMRRLNFMIPALAGMILQFQTMLLTGFAVVREREQGTLEQLIVTPIKSWELILGKILPFVLVAFINLWVTLLLGKILFNVPYNGSMWLLAGLSLLFMLGSLGLGLLISIIARTQIQAMHLALFINIPSMILTGFMFPRFNMPRVAYYFGYLLPMTQFLQIIRGIVIKGIGAGLLVNAIIPLAIYGLVVFFASVLLFRKRLE
jgi:ABC-2 type transport system permease protein